MIPDAENSVEPYCGKSVTAQYFKVSAIHSSCIFSIRRKNSHECRP